MSRRGIGIVLLLAGSVLFGFATGEVFYRLFLRTIPPLAMSSFSTGAAHLAYLTYGIGLGVALFAWTLFGILLSRYFSRAPSPAAPTAPVGR